MTTLLMMWLGSEWKTSVFQVQMRPKMGYTKFLFLPLLKSLNFWLLVILGGLELLIGVRDGHVNGVCWFRGEHFYIFKFKKSLKGKIPNSISWQ